VGGGALIRSSSHILVSHQKQHNQTAAGSRCSCQKRVSRISRTNPSTTNIVKHRIHLPLGSLRITEMQAAAILSIYPVSAALKGWQPLGAHLSRRSSYNSRWTIKSKFQKKLKTWKTNGIYYILTYHLWKVMSHWRHYLPSNLSCATIRAAAKSQSKKPL